MTHRYLLRLFFEGVIEKQYQNMFNQGASIIQFDIYRERENTRRDARNNVLVRVCSE